MDGESHKLATLEHACKVTNRIAEQEAAMEGQPLTVLGSARQLSIHPLIAEVRSQRGLLASLLKSLALPDGDDDEEQQALTRSQRARHARQRPMETEQTMTHKRNRNRKTTDPEALAARLPNELRSFGSYDDPEDLRSHWTAVADWLNQSAAGNADQLVMPVMQAAGLCPADWYRRAKLTRSRP